MLERALCSERSGGLSTFAEDGGLLGTVVCGAIAGVGGGTGAAIGPRGVAAACGAGAVREAAWE